MKVTKAQMQANRAHIVETAATLFRERGYDGIGVADLMAAAGFTHGGFYKHFGAKSDLMAEAATCGLVQSAAKAEALTATDFIQHYLSRQHRDAPGQGCTMAALSGDAARQPESVRNAFAEGIEGWVATLSGLSGTLPDSASSPDMRAEHIRVIAQVVGAMVLSRACPDDSPLADEILDVCRREALSRLPHGDAV
ncbi:TetR family transcriptional regulator [Alcaligenaceae bacterium B3P038]|nr:TetR family transcriptional regulator [Alcaligenaceae bacterium B3P038]